MTCIEHWTLPDGTKLTLRPVRPQDAPQLDGLITALTPRDRRWRFHGMVNGVSPERLRDMTNPVAPKHLACVVIAHLPHGDVLIGDARCAADETGTAAEFALMVAHRWRRFGVGGRALAGLQRAAADAGLRWLHGTVLEDNAPMLALMRRRGFLCTPSRHGDGLVAVEARTAPEPLIDRPLPMPPIPPMPPIHPWLASFWPLDAPASPPCR